MLQPGLRGSAAVTVGPQHTAGSLGSGDVPVFGTPALVALMEQAAVAALAAHLAPGDSTVGTRLDIAHLAATPVGQVVRAEAELTAVDGRKLTFAVAAFDGRQKIGEGRHERVLINRDRFLAKLSGS
ncbi:MAG: thioesterase family protein [Candidatus Methylomirabilales bacterium]